MNERTRLLDECQGIADQAKAARRGFTLSERVAIDSKIARVDAIDAQADDAKVQHDEARLKQLAQLSPEAAATGYNAGLDTRNPSDFPASTGAGAKGFLTFDTKAMAQQLVSRAPGGIKALVGAGGSTVDAPLATTSVTDLGKVAGSLLDVLPAVQGPREFSYLRQTTRTNNAAPVASGALKPTSVYTLERIEDRLRVIAHLSEPIDKFWLEDQTTLTGFVGTELLYGLLLAVNNQILNGVGTGENFTGLANVSGAQTQAYTTDKILTARNAMTKTETILGDPSGFFVFNPNDWAAIETQVITSGYALNAGGQSVPVEAAARRLWGQPVVTTTTVAAGTGYWVQRDSVSLYTDTAGVRIEWATVGDDFSRNLIRARCEGRFQLVVPRPLGVVKMALTGV